MYNDPLLSKRRNGTPNDPYLSLQESRDVINGAAYLTEIPNRLERVRIISDTPFYEITDGELKENFYKVDYLQGIVFFHQSQNGNQFTFSYKGEGVHYFPASRIWTKSAGEHVTETLETLIDDTQTKNTEITTKINEANQAIINTNNATADYNTTIENQIEIYKGKVATFTNIATTYPNPSVGWVVVTIDTHYKYRFDGTGWVEYGISDVPDGFSITVSSTPPTNIKSLWLDAPESVRVARVSSSPTAPTDTSMIWWETD